MRNKFFTSLQTILQSPTPQPDEQENPAEDIVPLTPNECKRIVGPRFTAVDVPPPDEGKPVIQYRLMSHQEHAIAPSSSSGFTHTIKSRFANELYKWSFSPRQKALRELIRTSHAESEHVWRNMRQDHPLKHCPSRKADLRGVGGVGIEGCLERVCLEIGQVGKLFEKDSSTIAGRSGVAIVADLVRIYENAQKSGMDEIEPHILSHEDEVKYVMGLIDGFLRVPPQLDRRMQNPYALTYRPDVMILTEVVPWMFVSSAVLELKPERTFRALQQGLIQAFWGLLYTTAESYAHIKTTCMTNVKLGAVNQQPLPESSTLSKYMNTHFLYGAVAQDWASLHLVNGQDLIKLYRNLLHDRDLPHIQSIALALPNGRSFETKDGIIHPIWDLSKRGDRNCFVELLRSLCRSRYDLSGLMRQGGLGWWTRAGTLGVLAKRQQDWVTRSQGWKDFG